MKPLEVIGVDFTMRVDVIPINELSEDMKQDWVRIQMSNPSFRSPFFYPELFISVAKYCPDIYVALLINENRLAGFLPFQKDKQLNAAQSILLCNYEGIISLPDQYWDIDFILRKMGLNSWNFKTIVNFEKIKSKLNNFQTFNSSLVDLNCGLDEYWTYIKSKKIGLKTLITNRRELENKIGPIRFVPYCNELKLLHQLLQWKITRHDSSVEWVNLITKILEDIYNLNDPLFKGILSALYAGDELLAVQYTFRYKNNLGGVLKAFNPNFTKYSVGKLLLQEVINNHEKLEYNIFDLGPGVFQYKQDFSNRLLPIIKGTFILNSFKERIKSINWLYQSLLPFARIKGKIVNNLSKLR